MTHVSFERGKRVPLEKLAFGPCVCGFSPDRRFYVSSLKWSRSKMLSVLEEVKNCVKLREIG